MTKRGLVLIISVLAFGVLVVPAARTIAQEGGSWWRDNLGGDGKLRAYDEDTGRVLWTGNLAGGSRGVPVVYTSKGRQYLVVVSQPGGGRGGRAAEPMPALPPETPRGFIAFSLPAR